ncbi:hypothetical protein BY996DRAFT_2165037 [Phakopsora pachyrhizi]|uniref:Uncharacterized protein n=1 Tax=Phakopsora pachyrhizi TaxID=170000 RepID=A0AAV0AM13_PHAPC|nr:hypothetical protein BY996DRAFT_2165037 [Phakopsora pachyrhizi]CAH7669252.1 hypothetical protein PPACK8108_LOCUS3839 [Phakopsora pachyrhizi]
MGSHNMIKLLLLLLLPLQAISKFTFSSKIGAIDSTANINSLDNIGSTKKWAEGTDVVNLSRGKNPQQASYYRSNAFKKPKTASLTRSKAMRLPDGVEFVNVPQLKQKSGFFTSIYQKFKNLLSRIVPRKSPNNKAIVHAEESVFIQPNTLDASTTKALKKPRKKVTFLVDEKTGNPIVKILGESEKAV